MALAASVVTLWNHELVRALKQRVSAWSMASVKLERSPEAAQQSGKRNFSNSSGKAQRMTFETILAAWLKLALNGGHGGGGKKIFCCIFLTTMKLPICEGETCHKDFVFVSLLEVELLATERPQEWAVDGISRSFLVFVRGFRSIILQLMLHSFQRDCDR